MPLILVRGFEHETVDRLNNQAKEHGRSLESEVQQIFELAAVFTADRARAASRSWRPAVRQ